MLVKPGEMIRSQLGRCQNADITKTESHCDGSTSFRSISPFVRENGISGSDPVNPRDPRYEHTQQGYLLMGAVGGTCLLLLVTLVLLGPEPLPLIVLSIMIFVLLIMSQLTVSVSNETLRIRFGPVGIVQKDWHIREIVSATVVANPWYYGFGIRWTPHGTLYNVSGHHAVKILLQSGKKVRIDTDEPEALAGAINRAIR